MNYYKIINTPQSTLKEFKYKIYNIKFIQKEFSQRNLTSLKNFIAKWTTLSTIAGGSVGRTLRGVTGASSVSTIGL